MEFGEKKDMVLSSNSAFYVSYYIFIYVDDNFVVFY